VDAEDRVIGIVCQADLALKDNQKECRRRSQKSRKPPGLPAEFF
jgi:hypothetical protein